MYTRGDVYLKIVQWLPGDIIRLRASLPEAIGNETSMTRDISYSNTPAYWVSLDEFRGEFLALVNKPDPELEAWDEWDMEQVS